MRCALWPKRDEERSAELGNKFAEEELRKAFALIALLWRKGVKKADVIAHSEAGINVAIAASIAPERFRNIVFVDPGGLIGQESFSALFKRFAADAVKDGIKMLFGTAEPKEIFRLGRAGKETVHYFFQNPARALKEASAISKSDIRNMLKDLHNRGMGIAVMQSVDDPVFPMERVQENLEAEGIDGFLSVKGKHDEIYTNPEKYVPAAEKLLELLERKRKTKSIRG